MATANASSKMEKQYGILGTIGAILRKGIGRKWIEPENGVSALSRHGVTIARECRILMTSGMRITEEAGELLIGVTRDIQKAAALIGKMEGRKRARAAHALSPAIREMQECIQQGIASAAQMLEAAKRAELQILEGNLARSLAAVPRIRLSVNAPRGQTWRRLPQDPPEALKGSRIPRGK